MAINKYKVDIKYQIKNVIGQYRVTFIKNLFHNSSFYFKKLCCKIPLEDIGRFFKTDKVDQLHSFNGRSYLKIYESYFSKKKYEHLNILEIGVKNAASLKTWKSYFKKGHVYGIDIDPSCRQYGEKRISIEIGSQDDIDFLSRAFGRDTMFDIIIDDGSHINRHIIQSFNYLFHNRLNPGGLYIIEDLKCSYEELQSKYDIMSNWPGMKYNTPGQDFNNDRLEINNFFEEIIHALDHQKGEVLSIHFWSMICIILKVDFFNLKINEKRSNQRLEG